MLVFPRVKTSPVSLNYSLNALYIKILRSFNLDKLYVDLKVQLVIMLGERLFTTWQQSLSCGLNLFTCSFIFCGRCRTKKCSSNQNVRSEHFHWLSYLPVNMYLPTSAHPVRADRICHHQRVHVCYADGARMAGKHQPDRPSWYCSTFTNCTIKFSHWWMTWWSVVMLSLVVWSVHAFRGCGFGWWFAGRVGCLLLVLSG